MSRTALVLLAAFALASQGCGKSPKPSKHLSPDGKVMMATPGIAASVIAPRIDQANQVHLPDDAAVVGVVINGHARAYLLEALKPFTSHVVIVGENGVKKSRESTGVPLASPATPHIAITAPAIPIALSMAPSLPAQAAPARPRETPRACGHTAASA